MWYEIVVLFSLTVIMIGLMKINDKIDKHFKD